MILSHFEQRASAGFVLESLPYIDLRFGSVVGNSPRKRFMIDAHHRGLFFLKNVVLKDITIVILGLGPRMPNIRAYRLAIRIEAGIGM